jgi:hypothetical protein
MEDGSKKVSRRELYDEEGRRGHLKFVHGFVGIKSKECSPYYVKSAPVKLAHHDYGMRPGTGFPFVSWGS